MRTVPILSFVLASSPAAGSDVDELPTGALAAEAEREIRKGPETRHAVDHCMGDIARMHARLDARSGSADKERGTSERDPAGEEREPSQTNRRYDRGDRDEPGDRKEPESSSRGTPRR